MSARVDAERAEMAFEARFEYAKQVRRLQESVARMTYEDPPVQVTEQARRLGITVHRVYFYLRVQRLPTPEEIVKWRRQGAACLPPAPSQPPRWTRGKLWGEEVRP